MKSFLNLAILIAAISILITGCSKDDDVATVASGAFTASGDVNDIIDGANSGNVDSLYFMIESAIDYDDLVVGKAKVQNGAFSVKLDSIQRKHLFKVKLSELMGDDGLVSSNMSISDTTAYMTEEDGLIIEAYKSNKSVGSIYRTNYTLSQVNDEQLLKGFAYGNYIYCNKGFTIKGTSKYTERTGNTTWETHYNTYDMVLRKGWNEIVYQITDISGSDISVSIVANTEPSGMRWLFLASDDESMKSVDVNSGLRQNLRRLFIARKRG